jgi:5'-3' exonuclease
MLFLIIMGVPSYFAWWAKRFPEDILYRCLPFKNVVLYLDFNGGIHPAVRTDPMMLYEDMNRSVCDCLYKLVEYVKPVEVWIAIDGVAPIAKLSQQRERRFKSVKESKAKRQIAAEYKHSVRNDPIDFNMISPGTEFMSTLELDVEAFITLKKQTIWKDIKFTLSGSGIPGEGEHKIMDEIRNRKDQGVKNNNCVYGLDADLLFLCLENDPDAFIVRENVHFSGRDDLGFDKDTFPYIYLDVSALQEKVTQFLDPYCRLEQLTQYNFKYDRFIGAHDGPYLDTYYDPVNDKHRLIRDYIYLCFLLGNDFVPRLPCLKIRNGSLNNLIVIYKKIAWSLGDYLVNTDLTINRIFFTRLINILADLEDEFMIRMSDQRYKDISRSKFRTHGKNPYECAIEKFDYIENQYDDTINGGTPGWRARYYQYHLGLKYRHEGEFRRKILPVCKEYLKGMNWILKYYTGHNSNWSWFYPYDAAPTAHDLSYALQDLELDYDFKPDLPVAPYVQLLSILPPDSAHLLPKAFRKLMTDGNSPIHFMYPLKITLSLIGNKFWHECKPRMPYINHKLLTDVVAAKYKYLTEEEKDRNTLQTIKLL